eukprot:6620564-Prymnesium_polylepis.2
MRRSCDTAIRHWRSRRQCRPPPGSTSRSCTSTVSSPSSSSSGSAPCSPRSSTSRSSCSPSAPHASSLTKRSTRRSATSGWKRAESSASSARTLPLDAASSSLSIAARWAARALVSSPSTLPKLVLHTWAARRSRAAARRTCSAQASPASAPSALA